MEWADKYRYLSPESSSSPGKWKTSRVEAARGPMLAVTEKGIKKITVMSCTQLLKTALIENICGYFIHQDPSPLIVMQPTDSLAETFSKDRLSKMIRDTKVLRELIAPKKSRDSENTIKRKVFPGGHITMVGSNSPTELASRPVRITLCDEVDKYPDSSKDEGDPIKLIEERTATFWNALNVHVCSPTIKGRSRIEQEYELSDKRIFQIPCPHCDHTEELQWKNVKWEKGKPDTARYQCPDCNIKWTEPERIKAIAKGKYVATAPFKGHAGFRVNKLASPWEPLSKLVSKWLEAQDDPEKLKTFINTQLAETWEERGEAPEHRRLYERRESYPVNKVPKQVVFLTAGVDVQADRLELEIVGWNEKRESWSIDYRTLMGDTANIESDCYKRLDSLLTETWTNENGPNYNLTVLAIDSGYNTSTVYQWARKYTSNRVMVLKGMDNLPSGIGHVKEMDVSQKGQRVKRRGVKVWPVGVSYLKSELYGWLNLNGAGDDGIYPHCFCHFPQYPEDYFKGLTAEKLVQRKKDGHTKYMWVKGPDRNEPLDCRIYARAASIMFGIDRFTPQDWNGLKGEDVHLLKFKTNEVDLEGTAKNKKNKEVFWNNSKKKSIW